MAKSMVYISKLKGRGITGSIIRNERGGRFNFNDHENFARQQDQAAQQGRYNNGQFMSRGDKNAYRTLARASRQSERTDNYDYTQPGNYDRNARYRNIRAAFGMTTG